MYRVKFHHFFKHYFELQITIFLDAEKLEMEPNPYNEEMMKSCEALEASLNKLKGFDSAKYNSK